MSTLTEALAEHGIRLADLREGGHKLTCPRCSSTRRNKADPCLSVTVEADGGAVWKCHNCAWAGGIAAERDRDRRDQRHRDRKPAKMPKLKPGDLPPEAIEWFRRRGIGADVLAREGISWDAGSRSVVFPYRHGGELVNAKFRRLDEKRFHQIEGGGKSLWRIDAAAGAEELVICEGELDVLACLQAGIQNAVSVPDGAPRTVRGGEIDPEDDRKFAYVWACRDVLDRMRRIILATDGDGPGRALAEELARRLGKERCHLVDWPDTNDTPRKDANDVLLVDGPEVLRECIALARPYPISGLHDFADFEGKVLALYHHGHERAFSTGFPTLDGLMMIRPGELHVVTGYPNHGKSELVDQLLVNLARQFGWRFALCSFENSCEEHAAKLVEKYIGAPFWRGPTQRMTEAQLRDGMAWVRDHFALIRADDEAPTIDWILEKGRGAVMRHGIRGLVIDPYNEIEAKRPPTMSETEYVSQLLGKTKRFAQQHGVTVWFIAHPAKPLRENGAIKAPTLYDISGSAHWVNKADFGVVVHRHDMAKPEAEVFVRKVRFKHAGKIGSVTLGYDRATGRYFEPQRQHWSDRG